MQKIIPCLWFNTEAEEAAKLYTSIFKNSDIQSIQFYGKASAKASGQKENSVLTVSFELAGQKFLALNGGPHFKLNPALSFFVFCESEREIDDFWKKLSAGGRALMELNKYPFAEKYGWCEDRYGVSWQLMLNGDGGEQKIWPAMLFTQESSAQAEEAMAYYTSLFPDSKILSIVRDNKLNVILHARFQLAGRHFIAMESSIPHAFTFTPAVSFIVNCEDQKEIDDFWQKLSAVKEAEQCGWLKDQFGISWQIVPKILPQMMTEKVMKALLQMKKLNIEELIRAANSV